MGIFLTIVAKLGGRKWMTGYLTSLLLPILANYLPADVAVTVVTAIAGIAVSFIMGQAYADGQSNGATSTVANLKLKAE